MGSLFRSEEMCLAQLFLQAGTAYQCVAELGEIGLVEFRDLNANVNLFQRRFVGEIRRCEDLERTFSYLDDEVKKSGLQLRVDDGADLSAPLPKDVLSIQEHSQQLQHELHEVSRNRESLKRRLSELQEYSQVLRQTQQFMSRAKIGSPLRERRSGEREPLLDPSVAQNLETKLSFVAGIVHPWKVAAFERLLWRACCGYMIANFAEVTEPMEDPASGELMKPVAFLISYWGEQIGQKVKKICDCYHCRVFPYPSSLDEQQETLQSLQTRIEDLKSVLNESEEYLSQVLHKVVLVLNPWVVKIRKMKAIYLVLNQCNFDITGKCLIAEVWCPRSDLQQLQHALEEGSRKSGASVPSFYHQIPTNTPPPTLNRTNHFTAGFQSIVDAYGVGNYQEVNPAIYTIITFPFLFAVMFGDVGHGLIMAVFAAWMVLNENDQKLKKESSEIWRMFFAGRYLILLMGVFSIYTGLIYDDCFSRSLSIFPSAWHVKPMFTNSIWRNGDLREIPFLTLDPNITNVFEGVYPFGIDPIWQLANNRLNFLNSFKMKMSVILGIVHMCFGVILSVFNYVHFKKPWLVVLVFLPEIMFMLCLFGYLVFMIVYKWFAYSAANSQQAPSILIHFIDMFLFTGSSSNPDLYPHQRVVQIVLVVLAVFSIPVLLLGKPLYLCLLHRLAHRTRWGGYQSINQGAGNSVNLSEQDIQRDELKTEPQFDPADVFMKQAIHTIEYCLSCISNTASYLRLWALSLAHAELSEVLWNMVLRKGLRRTEFYWSVFLVVAFVFFAVLTVAILLIMEGLSAFLHALRLHWVEFQNKFYTGSGYSFLPFSFFSLDNSDGPV